MKQNKSLLKWLPVIAAVFFICGMLAGGLLKRTNGLSSSTKKFATIMNLIESEYVDKVDLDSLLEETLPELLSNLDPHSFYIPSEKLQGVNEELEGSFAGVGIQFMVNNDSITVIEVISGGPSEKVGLMPGDRIVSIDGESVAGTGISSEDVKTKLRGEEGTRVSLGIKRATSKKILNFDVTRGNVPVSSIDASYMINDSTGFIRVKRFNRTTYNEFIQSLIKLRAEGAKNYIIDLRGNTGGFMDVAILMANEFLEPKSVIVAKKGRYKSNYEIYLRDG
ncbi:MAG: PDZ domain-containing protein, partial [Muribaculaceae bacterium]|nr:PDZ domain-containing protein [Muribaculaceae bacterium]